MLKRIATALACLILTLELTGFSGPVPPEVPPPLGPESALTTAGPDEYGYTLTDETTIPFVDISGSVPKLTFTDSDNGIATVTIRAFDYYSLSDVTTAYVSVNGFISFDVIKDTSKSKVSKPFPTDSNPNSLLAPFWYDLTLELSSGVYLDTIDSPDPDVACTIIQWNNVKSTSATEYYTFEIILFDSGHIGFIYQPETGSYTGVTAGIEDADGVTGLNYAIPSLILGKTVFITRPDSGYHLKGRPQVSSGFFTNGEIWFNVDVTNTTDSSYPDDTDSYTLAMELLPESDPVGYPWGLTFYNPTRTTVITSIPDLTRGDTTQLCMRVTAGGDQMPGYFARFKITLTSQGNPSRYSTIYLQTTIGAPFAQLYQDNATGLNLDLNRVSERTTQNVSTPGNGSYMAMNLINTGNYIISWVEGSYINYRMYRQYQGTLSDIHQINASQENNLNPDLSPAVAGSRNGYVGILYLMNQFETDGPDVLLNSNVYYALIDNNGNIVDGYPLNLTNNPYWLNTTTGYPTSGPAIPQYQDPRIVPFGQDKMGLVWRTTYSPTLSAQMDKIEGFVAETDGSDFYYFEIPGWSASNRYFYPATTSLDDGRFIISYINFTIPQNPWEITYTVIDLIDNPPDYPYVTISTPTPILGSSSYQIDLVQLDTGQVFFGWVDLKSSLINYAILGSDLDGLDVVPTGLTYEDFPGHPNYRAGGYPSVTRTSNSNGIITWQDQDWHEQLYYSVIGPDGSQITPPSLYRRVESSLPEAQVSTNNYGNAPLAAERIFMPLIFNDFIYHHAYNYIYYLSLIFK
jgi:hypothetical protein